MVHSHRAAVVGGGVVFKFGVVNAAVEDVVHKHRASSGAGGCSAVSGLVIAECGSVDAAVEDAVHKHRPAQAGGVVGKLGLVNAAIKGAGHIHRAAASGGVVVEGGVFDAAADAARAQIERPAVVREVVAALQNQALNGGQAGGGVEQLKSVVPADGHQVVGNKRQAGLGEGDGSGGRVQGDGVDRGVKCYGVAVGGNAHHRAQAPWRLRYGVKLVAHHISDRPRGRGQAQQNSPHANHPAQTLEHGQHSSPQHPAADFRRVFTKLVIFQI